MYDPRHSGCVHFLRISWRKGARNRKYVRLFHLYDDRQYGVAERGGDRVLRRNGKFSVETRCDCFDVGRGVVYVGKR